jgi:hypothetical protein
VKGRAEWELADGALSFRHFFVALQRNGVHLIAPSAAVPTELLDYSDQSSK